MLQKLKNDQRGAVAMVFALMIFPVLLAVGGTVDYGDLLDHRAKLQSAADATALAAARELGIASTKPSQVQAVAEEYASINLSSARFSGSGSDANVDVATDIKNSRTEVEVTLSSTWKPNFASLVFEDKITVDASATAALAGSETICILTLSDSLLAGLSMLTSATVNANNCGVFSNSQRSYAVTVGKGSRLSGSSIYSSGGYLGPLESFSPQPVTDSPPIDDPLITRAPPTVDACLPAKTDVVITSGYHTLNAGTYCGGIRVEGDAVVNLNPGVYVLKDGPLSFKDNAELRGENVGFYFTGSEASFYFSDATKVNITAPADGPMAGILFFEDRDAQSGRLFLMRSRNAERFEGTVYLPRGRFFVDGQSRVGQQSNWTAIIAYEFHVGMGPDIQVNSDFATSDVPAPEGIVPNSGRVQLLK